MVAAPSVVVAWRTRREVTEKKPSPRKGWVSDGHDSAPGGSRENRCSARSRFPQLTKRLFGLPLERLLDLAERGLDVGADASRVVNQDVAVGEG